MNNNSNNCGGCGTTCSECGRPWAICKQDGGCGCNKCKDIKFCEYGRMANGCIREKQPGCPMQAVIPSVTVESIEGIKNLADCLVHVSDINTTFYIDDKHRPIITWAGPIDIPGYDMENNPNNYRDQIVTDVANQIAVIYDKSGKGYLFGLAENIDLQEQVNNKLDEMAENGELAEMLSEQYNELRNETNQRITTFEAQVNSKLLNIDHMVQRATSGSPLVVSSVSDMTQTDRVYVNTSDGNWYYYDGNSWQIGGVYQSSGLADGSVSPIKTTFAKRTHQLFDKDNYAVIQGQVNLGSTQIIANPNSRTLYIPCEENTDYHIKKTLGSRFGIFTTVDAPAVGVAASNVVNGSEPVAISSQNVTYTTPAGAKYLCVFFYNIGGNPNITESSVASTIMISEGSTDYPYEPYAYLNINDLLENNSISRNKLKLPYVINQRGSFSLDFANNKVKMLGVDKLIDEALGTIYAADSAVANSELTFPATSGLFVLTATVSGKSVTSYQIEAWSSRNNGNKILLVLDRTYQCYATPYDYGSRVAREARYLNAYKGNITINLERRKIYFSGCAFNYNTPAGTTKSCYNFYDGFDGSVDIPTTSGLKALTATVSNANITSLQFEPYNSINPANYIILYIEGGYSLTRTWSAPYDYGGRITGANTIKPELVSLAMFNSIAAIGDSYTQGSMYMDGHWYNSPNKQGSYIGILGRMNGTDWYNYGVGGTTTKTYQTSVDGLPKVLSEDPRDFYFLALGINDAQQGADYLGTIDDITADYTQNPDTFYGNYAKIIEQLQAHAPKAKFLMVGCMRPRSSSTYYDTYTGAIKEIAEHYGIPFVDPYDDAFFNSNILTQTTTATTSYHPTPQAYCGIALALQRLFSRAVEDNVTYYYNSNEASNIQSN